MSASFTDLRTRVLSAIVMLVVGLGALWVGGLVFGLLAVALAGVMAWELFRMLVPEAPSGRAEANGLSAAILVAAFSYAAPSWMALAGFAAGALVLALRVPRDRWIFGGYLFVIMLATHALIIMRLWFPVTLVPWLVAVVIASDVAGYFAGRLIGGPKFWPRVSPKKTWSGTVAGWILAGLVGWALGAALGIGTALVAASAILAFAGQLGDIAESAIKRHAGVKDSSGLIPGHGGVLDRFDALLAVAVVAWLLLMSDAMSVLVR